jgi:hypothetical protein
MILKRNVGNSSILFSFFLGLIVLAGVVSATNSLVAEYRFDGDVNDSSGNNNNGVTQGDPVFVDGFLGQALSFDGVDDYVEVADNSIFSFGNGVDDSPFSLSAWIKRRSFNSPHIIVSKYRSQGFPRNQEYTFRVEHEGNFTIVLFDTSGDYRKSVTTGHLITDSQWHYVVATYDGSETVEGLKLYFDGVETPTTIVLDNPSYVAMEDTTSTFKIGVSHQVIGLASFFNGTIDEVRVYDHTLSDIEVLANYFEGRLARHEAENEARIGLLESAFDTLKDFVKSVYDALSKGIQKKIIPWPF